MIRLSSVEILSFLLVFGLMCFGLGVIFVQYLRLKESINIAVGLVAELTEDRKKLDQEFQEKKKQLEEEFDRKLAEAILENTKNLEPE